MSSGSTNWPKDAAMQRFLPAGLPKTTDSFSENAQFMNPSVWIERLSALPLAQSFPKSLIMKRVTPTAGRLGVPNRCTTEVGRSFSKIPSQCLIRTGGNAYVGRKCIGQWIEKTMSECVPSGWHVILVPPDVKNAENQSLGHSTARMQSILPWCTLTPHDPMGSARLSRPLDV